LHEAGKIAISNIPACVEAEAVSNARKKGCAERQAEVEDSQSLPIERVSANRSVEWRPSRLFAGVGRADGQLFLIPWRVAE
jgi:hypothetical protein